MRVKKLEDLTPHEALYEKMAFCGQFLPILDGVKVIYYKRYRQADIIAPDGYKYPYVEYSPTGKEEHTFLTDTAAKIMLMRELVKNFGVGGHVDSGIDKKIKCEIKPLYKPKEIPKVKPKKKFIQPIFEVLKLGLEL